MLQLQKHSNYGSSTPAVARTLPQGADILSSMQVTEAQKDACKTVLMELSRHLVRCVEIFERVAGEVDEGKKIVDECGLRFQSNGQAVTLPGVADLHSQAEAFLQSVKLAVRETAGLVEPFYGCKHDHRFHSFAAWAEGQFGNTDMLTQTIRAREPWVKSIVTMRNAVDHPANKAGGRLMVHNFRLAETHDNPVLAEPMWGLSGGPESSICSDMEAVIERCIELGEEILVCLFYKFKPNFPMVIYEIPEEQRDRSFPKRLRVGLAFESQNA